MPLLWHVYKFREQIKYELSESAINIATESVITFNSNTTFLNISDVESKQTNNNYFQCIEHTLI